MVSPLPLLSVSSDIRTLFESLTATLEMEYIRPLHVSIRLHGKIDGLKTQPHNPSDAAADRSQPDVTARSGVPPRTGGRPDIVHKNC
jgi:hypothetical protein